MKITGNQSKSKEINRTKVYSQKTKVDIPRDKHGQLTKGLPLDDGTKAHGRLIRQNRKGGLIYWKVILSEGKTHEVKRIFKALDSRVIHLHRYSFAGLEVDSVSPGKYQVLKEKEIKRLVECIPN